ncbi:MAG TPA: PAS domain S-box protein [Rhodocyclaceae bacterium]|nr:PAS domain S-box protein [Rhodocyclaceae bacterium]HRQ48760.1 PAS domain S-box protein [Rhodocyclaceae bacterium]
MPEGSIAYALAGIIILALVAAFLLSRRIVSLLVRMREAEVGLQAAVKQHHLLLQHAGQGIYGLDSEGCVTFVNQAAEALLGYRADTLIGRKMHPIMHHTRPDGAAYPDAACPISATLRDGVTRKIDEELFWRADGSALEVEYVVAALEDAGRIAGAVVLFEDVRERRRARESLARWQQIFEHANWGVVVCRAQDGTLESMNPAFARMHGYRVDELVGRPLAELLAPGTRTMLEETTRAIRDSGHLRFEAQHLHRDGRVFPVLVDVTVSPVAEDADASYIVNVLDIGEQKAQEAKLQRSEAILRLMLESLPVGVSLADTDGRVSYRNPADRKIWGCPVSDQGACEGWWADGGSKIEPHDWALARAVGSGDAVTDELVDIKAPNGDRKTILNSAVPMFDAEGRFEGAIVINQDITKARRAELALREREASLAQAQAQARLGSWKLDVDSGALEWSDECYRIFALPIGTPVSYASMLERVHPDDRVAVDRQWRAALAGASYDIQHRVLVTGEVRWVRQRARIEFEPDGSPRSGIGTAQEITEIKLKEQELLRSRQLLRDLAAHHELIREQERARIAREIHDELGQYLTALRMDAAMIQMRFATADPELERHVAGMKETIDQTIVVVRDIASSLRPGALNMGLVSAAEWLLAGFEERTGVKCRLDAPAEELGLDDTRVTAVFRILQESLTNVARHANAVSLRVCIERDDGMFRMHIVDDGVGFDAALVREKRTFGLLGIRERAMMFGGKVSIDSRPGGGTSVNLTIPLQGGEHE